MILDEHGVKWTVMAHDPASRLINTLKREGFTKIVLPRYTYMTGEIRGVEELPECKDYLNRVRMYDCASILTKNHSL